MPARPRQRSEQRHRKQKTTKSGTEHIQQRKGNTHGAITPLTSDDLGTPHALNQLSSSSSSLPATGRQQKHQRRGRLQTPTPSDAKQEDRKTEKKNANGEGIRRSEYQEPAWQALRMTSSIGDDRARRKKKREETLRTRGGSNKVLNRLVGWME